VYLTPHCMDTGGVVRWFLGTSLDSPAPLDLNARRMLRHVGSIKVTSPVQIGVCDSKPTCSWVLVCNSAQCSQCKDPT